MLLDKSSDDKYVNRTILSGMDHLDKMRHVGVIIQLKYIFILYYIRVTLIL
jgi:hypothetical protein